MESTKSVSDLYAPLSGEIVAVNDALDRAPELVNADPYGQGWMYEVRLADQGALDSLLDVEPTGPSSAEARCPTAHARCAVGHDGCVKWGSHPQALI